MPFQQGHQHNPVGGDPTEKQWRADLRRGSRREGGPARVGQDLLPAQPPLPQAGTGRRTTPAACGRHLPENLCRYVCHVTPSRHLHSPMF